MTLWQVFESAATRFADRTAVELQRANTIERWSYRQLHDAALARAAWLAAARVRPGDRCAILADNSAEWCATYLGIVRIGAVVVPLDTNYSPAQIVTIMREASPRVIFVGDRLSAPAREGLTDLSETRMVRIADIPACATSDALPTGSGSTDDPAAIFYTSGTTADPKGVVVSHGNLVAERDAASQVVSVNDHDRVLGLLPLSHSLGLLVNLLLPLAVGARVVFLEAVDSTGLVRAVAERRITMVACVPQFIDLIHQRVMQEVARQGAPKRYVFRTLVASSFLARRLGINVGPRVFDRAHALVGRQMRFFITGGSKVDPAVGRALYALGFTILQTYGLTETAGAATITAPDEAHLDTVGRVVPGQELKVLPAEHPELDGEIAIRGPIVMQGYFNRPDRTQAVMRDGWFLSGDLGRLDADGRLTITGRKKDVISLATGTTINPAEIEGHYRQSAYVKDICVFGLPRHDELTTERLFAVVVPDMERMRERRIVNAGDLLRFEMEGQSVHLPAHQRVLDYDVWFEPLPRTTTGQVKRNEVERRLRQTQQETARAREGPDGVPAQWADDHAAATAAIIAARTKGAVAPGSNLEMDLGLDSMGRVELVTELEQRFGIRIARDQAHQILTVAQLIEAVRPGAHSTSERVTADSWTVLLRDLPPVDDPALRGLLERRPIAGPVLWVLIRFLRLLMPPMTFTGVEHLPDHGPYILAPNHQGFLDPFLVCGGLPYRVFKQLFFVGAADYFETPVMSWVARQANCVPVDPDANLVPAMKAGAFGLAHGKILMLFPEGERSIDGTVKRFKKGAPILSRHVNAPIVPVAIRGAYELWPRQRGINWNVLLPWSGHRIFIDFGAAMQFDESLGYSEAAQGLRDRVDEMWQRLPRSHDLGQPAGNRGGGSG